MVTSPRGTATPLIPLDFTTSYTRDRSGRVLTVTDPTGAVTTNGYDDNGNVISVENANANTTTFVYDAEGRLTGTHRPDSTVVATGYNDNGQVEIQTDANAQTTTYGYDDLGRLATVTDPLANVTAYGYDRAGNLIQVTQPGGNCAGAPATGCITRGYDAANQLRTVAYSDGVTPNVTDVAYDDDGRRIGVDYGTTSSVTWAYDSLGRLTASNDGTAVGYGYDLGGNVTRISYPGANEVTRGYDDAGRMITSTDWVAGTTTFDYDDDSNLVSSTYPDAAQVDTATVDDAGRVSSIVMSAGASSLATLGYSRDDLGQLTGEDQSGLPGPDSSWGYNALEQLVDRNSTSTWGYDAGDNLVVTGAGVRQVFNAANQLCSVASSGAGTCSVSAVGATTFGYDDRGNRTTVTPPSPAAATTYGYDQADRLTGVDTVSAVYGYDSDGLRLSKTVGADSTAFAWDRSGSLPLLLTEATGTDTTAYLYGPGGLAYAQINPDATVTYLHHDQIGSVRLLTDDTGSVTGSVTYDPYGAVSASTGTLSRLGFAGEYTDDETGFVYLRARYYGPATGQFLTRDPLAASTREPYGYTAGNPLNATDPSGLFGIPGTNLCVAIADDSCDNSAMRNWSGNVLAGAGNALTFGHGVDLAAKLMGKGDNFTACYVSPDSWAYRGGAIGGFVFGAAFGAGATASSTRFGDAAYRSRYLGADSYLFGNESLGTHARVGGGLLNPVGKGAWRIGWSVNGQAIGGAVPGFRAKGFGLVQYLFHASGF